MGGGGKSEAEKTQDLGYYSSMIAAQQSKKVFEQTEPLRTSFMDQFQNIQGGQMPFDQTVYPGMLSAARQPIESQYNTAKENIMATTPRGGKMFEDLSDVETARANSIGNLSAQYLMDFINKAYGAAWQVPQYSISQLGGIGGAQSQTASTFGQGASGVGSSAMGSCCFNFLEAEGEIYSTVRRYRDEHYLKDGWVSVGYVRSAMILVPLMVRFGWFKLLIRALMTRPLKAYSRWYYGENRSGFVFYPFKFFWVNSWRILGVI